VALVLIPPRTVAPLCDRRVGSKRQTLLTSQNNKIDMSNKIIIVVHVSCDFACHFFLGAIFYALYTCTGY